MKLLRQILIALKARFIKIGLGQKGNRSLRGYGIITLFSISAFSVGVFALDKLSSHYLFSTTFVATLETQTISARIGPAKAVIPGVSGSRISLSDTSVDPSTDDPAIKDLTNLLGEDTVVGEGSLIFSAESETTHLELDNLVVPPGRAVEISTIGRDKYFLLQLIGGEPGAKVSATVVWNGDITIRPDGDPMAKNVGARQWSALVPSVEIENPVLLEPIYSPIRVKSLSTARLRLAGDDQVATSALLGGDIQFYFGNQPGERIVLKPGEFATFSELDALVTNFVFTESGMKFVLVGKAAAVKTGYLTNLRDVAPSVFDGIRSIPSIALILSALFTFLLAGFSATSTNKNELE